MPLNPEAVGAVGDPHEISWNSKDALLYAVGIGAAHKDLQFSTENTKDTAQVVYPTFAVVAGSGSAPSGVSALSTVGTFNWAMLVHGSQAITLHRPIPVVAKAIAQDRVAAMYDKGKAAVIVIDNDVARFHAMEARFASPVMPGDALTVRMWRIGVGQAVFTASVGDRAVIDQGLVTFTDAVG